jgi:hypothetical protein
MPPPSVRRTMFDAKTKPRISDADTQSEFTPYGANDGDRRVHNFNFSIQMTEARRRTAQAVGRQTDSERR